MLHEMASLLVALAFSLGQTAGAEDELTLGQALAAARAANPTLAAARLRLAVDQAGIAVARERPNPELRYEREKETPLESLTLTQPIEIGGKRGRRIALAQAAARSGEAELSQIEAEVMAEVQRAFFALAAAQRRLELAREVESLATRARDAAAARYEVGDVSRLDVLQAELALSRAQNEASALVGDSDAARAELNALVGRAVSARTVVVEQMDEAVPDPAAATAVALEANSALAVLDRRVAEAEARAALARAEQVPDPTFEAAVTHRAEPDFTWGWRATVGITLPVFTRHRAAVRVEQAALAQARVEREALAQRIRGGVAAAALRAAAQRRQYLRYRDEILPRSREAEAMAEESYRAGQTGLVALLQSLQAARELRATALQAAGDYEAALSALRQAMTAGLR